MNLHTVFIKFQALGRYILIENMIAQGFAHQRVVHHILDSFIQRTWQVAHFFLNALFFAHMVDIAIYG